MNLGNHRLKPLVTGASSSHCEETSYHDPLIQLQQQSFFRPTLQAHSIPHAASVPGQQLQRHFAELTKAGSWPHMQ